MEHTLKNRFPVKAYQFQEYCDYTSQKMEEQAKQISSLQEQLMNIKALLDKISIVSTEMKEAYSKIDEELQVQRSELHEIKVANATPTIWYNSEFERAFFKDSFGKDFEEKIDFEKSFLSLIGGLDTESIQTVCRVLNRQKKLYEREKKYLNIFTLEEQRVLRDINQNFYGNILKISDSLFCYNGYLLPQNHFEVIVFYYKYFLDSFKTIDKIRNKSIIDAGAFIGDSAILFSEYTHEKVYSFEAIPELYRDMQKTIELNSLSNVVAENMAISSSAGTLTFESRGNCSTAKTHAHEGLEYSEEISVKATTIDQYVRDHNLKVGLIKVDVEGSEQEVIAGALDTIKTQKPALIFSIYHNADDFFHIKPILEKLNLGYKFKIRQPQIGKVILETLLFAEIDDGDEG